ncbi:AMP-binding protein [Paraburkholderia fungorum]|uniref:AMP-binding protein n=1 Tax=Paraburkholderia fungorum TaxID=134537 RepID=UPI001C1F0FDC|nr:AMP-binding protein [Paraburkholderia fungorum]MBU7437862.1 AMP-binding protein [Paraburkholderia fungorum]
MGVEVGLAGSYWAKDTSLEVLDCTLGDLLRKAAAEVPERIALVEGIDGYAARRRWSYRALLEAAEQVAHALLSRFAPGERIAVWAPNCPEWILLQHGAGLAGIVLVPVNPAFLADELTHVLKTSEVAGVFYASLYRNNDLSAVLTSVRARLPHLRETVCLSDWEDFVDSASARTPLPAIAPGDMVQIQYTSGTTGFPKGACLHQRGIVNASRFAALRAGFGDGGVWVNAMPLFHVGGCGVSAVGALAQRGTFVLMPGFDAAKMLEMIESERGTATLVVPTMLVAMLDHPDRPRRDLSSLKLILSGASAVPSALVRRTTTTFGCKFSILFGQTELNGVITQTGGDDSPEDQAETAGRPLPQMELKIADPISGEVLPLDTSGEICARGYQTMQGYFNAADATSATLREDGWLHTGDLGAMDERGYVRVTGRLKDMIIRGGENIYPREIEEVLFDHPDIAHVCVIGLPDERWGEVVAAVIRLSANDRAAPDTAPPCAAFVDGLHAWCRSRLAAYKTPAIWFFIDEWPLTASGKVRRHVLREQILGGGHRGLVVTKTPARPAG